MDQMMPKMTGMEAVKHIRNLNYTHPIIALTADAIVGMKELFLANGFDDYISKPADMNTLNEKLEKWISPNESASVTVENKISIRGIDTEYALSLYDGDEELLAELLQLFADDIPAELDKLRGVSAENLKSYAIDVHTVKGSAAGIGAIAIQDFAARMEKMAKNGDFNGVSAENENFINESETLVTNIREWFQT
jgi:CheY-like chemotaxis protein